ncbi:MAG: leucine-rich repeat domain-containing protein [Promethearchaeota archaeon]
MKEFRVNQYIILRLENGKTIIYVGGKLFDQCKYLLLDIPIKNYEALEDLESIDEAAEKLSDVMEGGINKPFNIPFEVEFWGHCSNLQVWYENNYNTSLLHRSLAFPLLKKLADLGDPFAKIKLKEEIIKRFESGFFPVIEYLINEGYLNYFEKNELLQYLIKSKDEINCINNIEKLLLGKFEISAKFDFFEDLSTITCYDIIIENNHITGIRINWYDLYNIPEEIFKLKYLKKLFLTHTKINEIPSEIGNLKHLEELKLFDNNITELPKSFAKLTSLKKLDLVYNNINVFSEALTELKALKYLYLNQNDIKSIPESILKLQNLKQLHLKNNPLESKSLPKLLDQLKKIEWLNI